MVGRGARYSAGQGDRGAGSPRGREGDRPRVVSALPFPRSARLTRSTADPDSTRARRAHQISTGYMVAGRAGAGSREGKVGCAGVGLVRTQGIRRVFPPFPLDPQHLHRLLRLASPCRGGERVSCDPVGRHHRCEHVGRSLRGRPRGRKVGDRFCKQA